MVKPKLNLTSLLITLVSKTSELALAHYRQVTHNKIALASSA